MVLVGNMTVEDARLIALSMPEASEGEHMNHPDFRVRKKIFMTLWPDDNKAVVFVDPERHEGLVANHPQAFALNGWSKKYGALEVFLDHIKEGEFREFVEESWTRKAPKGLVKEHLGG